ncbi:MAG: hypothetical protein V6Z78_01840 [Holosporaceae bacterium]
MLHNAPFLHSAGAKCPLLSGSFQQSCRDCQMDDRCKTFTCICTNKEGRERPTLVSENIFKDCPHALQNNNGHLSCDPSITPSFLKNL